MILQTEEEYEKALVRIEEIWDSVEGKPLGHPLRDEFEARIDEVAEYEKIHYPIGD